jgi:hypothetical protein
MPADYGPWTVARPRVEYVPVAPEGATLSECPYCGCQCWQLALEKKVSMPGGFTAACSLCAMKRGSHQREMDEARAAREREMAMRN